VNEVRRINEELRLQPRMREIERRVNMVSIAHERLRQRVHELTHEIETYKALVDELRKQNADLKIRALRNPLASE